MNTRSGLRSSRFSLSNAVFLASLAFWGCAGSYDPGKPSLTSSNLTSKQDSQGGLDPYDPSATPKPDETTDPTPEPTVTPTPEPTPDSGTELPEPSPTATPKPTAKPTPTPAPCRKTEIPVNVVSDDNDSQVERILDALHAHLSAKNCVSAAAWAEKLIKEQLKCGLWSKADDSDECSLDNGVSTQAVTALIQLEFMAGTKSSRSSSIKTALNALVNDQFAIGAWAQEPARKSSQPVIAHASYPSGYPRDFDRYERPKDQYDYTKNYTLNDNAHVNVMELMLYAYKKYNDKRFLNAAIAGGDFLKRAQLPSPQRAWAQQYDYKLQPSWAREHEPPAAASRETWYAMMELVALESVVKNKNYCDAIKGAYNWLKASLELQPSGQYRGPRWYELKSNLMMYTCGKNKDGSECFTSKRSEVDDDDLRENKEVNNFYMNAASTLAIIKTVCP